tara:strand:+ start:236 stop:580 length:345 start_codon:yes stop_codon:yes gene_type:complete
MVIPIGPIGPSLYNTCTYADFVAIAEVTVLPVYTLQQASGWQQAYQSFINYQWNNYSANPQLTHAVVGCKWIHYRTNHWIAQLANLTPGTYNYNLKQAKISWGNKAYKYCCASG